MLNKLRLKTELKLKEGKRREEKGGAIIEQPSRGGS